MFKEIKQFISSMDLAIILIAAISGLSISSTFFDTPEVFRSIPFRILVSVFFINLLTCSLKLLPNVFRTLKRDGDYVLGKKASLKIANASETVILDYLKENRYQIKKSKDEKAFFATKNKAGYIAPHVLHMGLLIIIVGSFLTTFQTTDTIQLSQGDKLSLPKTIEERIGKGEIKLDKFVTEYDENGAVKNWISTFDLNVEGFGKYQDVTTRVNHPFKEKGLSIYQMAYANQHLFHITGDKEIEGDYVFPEGQMIPLNVKKGSTLIQIAPMAENIALFYTFDENGNQESQSALKKNDVFTLSNGLVLKYEKKIDSTILQVKYNPYLFIVFLGFIVTCFASTLFWFGRYREVWLYISEDGQAYAKVVSKSKEVKDELLSAFLVENKENI